MGLDYIALELPYVDFFVSQEILFTFLMSLVAHRLGRVEFWISNICCCFLQSGAVEKIKLEIIDQYPTKFYKRYLFIATSCCFLYLIWLIGFVVSYFEFDYVISNYCLLFSGHPDSRVRHLGLYIQRSFSYHSKWWRRYKQRGEK